MSSKSPNEKSLSEDVDTNEDQERPEEYCRGGYHYVRIGDTLCDERYKVVRKLGWGVFSTVWLCTDRKHNDYVAIKIAKSKKSYRLTALDEIKALSKIKSADTNDPFASRVVTLLDHFYFKGNNGKHYSLVFEVMGDSLYKFMSTYYRKGMPLKILKRIVRQVLEGLTYLHTKCQIIHTDIKPENILLTIDKKGIEKMHSEVENLMGICGESCLPESFVSMAIIENREKSLSETDKKVDKSVPQKSSDEDFSEISIKIADLGNACNIDDHNKFTIQTRPYRCPEVILGSGFGTPSDIWSTACMIFEMATGDDLFEWDTDYGYRSKNQNQLYRIIEMLGPIPKRCRKGKHYKKYFTKSGQLLNCKVIENHSLDRLLIEEYKWEPTVANSFAQFLLPMLQIDPKKRADAYECLSNQWLNI